MSLTSTALRAVGLGAFLLFIAGCAAVAPSVPPPPPPVKLPPAARPADNTPGALAALELTEEARILLAEGRTGDAIRLLERAVNLHPDSGRSYYYLAEAWIARGDLRQAAEFNGLAEAYTDGGREWRVRIRRQKERIEGGAAP